jgi:hypothetical protein
MRNKAKKEIKRSIEKRRERIKRKREYFSFIFSTLILLGMHAIKLLSKKRLKKLNLCIFVCLFACLYVRFAFICILNHKSSFKTKIKQKILTTTTNKLKTKYIFK